MVVVDIKGIFYPYSNLPRVGIVIGVEFGKGGGGGTTGV
jgi:hypothetical protein